MDPQEGVPTREAFWQRIHPDDRDRVYEDLLTAARKKRDYVVEYRIVWPDGTVKYHQAIGHPMLDATGEIVAYLGTGVDITKRKHVERALRDSEELKRRIIESSKDCIKVLDLEGNLLFMSSGGQRLLEIDNVHTYLNTCWVDFWQPEDRPRVSEAVAVARAGGIAQFQAFCPSAKGAPRWWDVITTPICNADGQPEQLLSVSRDITERKRAEAEARESERRYREMQSELAHANRVATMGQLTASIAHEVNQPLSGLVSSGNACLRWLTREPPSPMAKR
jgi:PAS domain S-box-containing protein